MAVNPQTAVNAILRFERVSQDIAAKTKAIAQEFDSCSVGAAYNEACRNGDRTENFVDEKFRVKTHIWEALNASELDESGYGMRVLDSDEIEEFLFNECAACHRAWAHIKERRILRLERGIALRAIRSIGRAAIAIQPAPSQEGKCQT